MASMSTSSPRRTVAAEGRMTGHAPLLALALGVVIVDRLSKNWVEAHLHTGDTIPVIVGVLRISHVMNAGAAFSLFSDSSSPESVRAFLMLFSAFAVMVVSYFFGRAARHITLTSTGLALILAGALGNLYDRARFGYVTDFLEVHIGSYHWPDFNIADSAICIGAALLLLQILSGAPKDEKRV